MRNALVLIALVVSLAACGGKKKSVANPSNSGAGADTDSKAAGSNDEKNVSSPADPNDPTTKSSDPCEGGE